MYHRITGYHSESFHSIKPFEQDRSLSEKTDEAEEKAEEEGGEKKRKGKDRKRKGKEKVGKRRRRERRAGGRINFPSKHNRF